LIAVAGRQRIAYVVPTKDRPDDLDTLLASLARQTRPADQIVVVDGGDRPVTDIVARHSALPIDYVREYPPSLARQRNAGMARVAPDITVAGYLDDDLVLEPDASERMYAFWEAADRDVGGAAFNILNQPHANASALTRLFLLNGRTPGAMLPSGWPSQIPTLGRTVETEWLYGGATLWRREVLREFGYDEWFVGHGYGEDVDFSYRVSRKYRLFVLSDARVHHFTRPIRLASQFTLGRQQVVNRLYFIRKSGAFPAPAVTWALFGQLVFNVLAGLADRERAGWRRAAGNVDGLLDVMRRGLSQIGGHYK
jgi:GT2 family glycosyltransferase